MELFNFSPELMKKAEAAERKSLNTFYRIEKNCRHNSEESCRFDEKSRCQEAGRR